MDKSQQIEKLKNDIETWEGVNKHIVKKAQERLKELECEETLEEKVEPVKEEKVESKPAKVKKLNKKEIKDLTKDEQVEMLNKLGVDEIPRYEKDRVELIFKLQ